MNQEKPSSETPTRGPLSVDELNIDELVAGTLTRLMIKLIDNGMGQPVSVPVIVAKGKKPGPVFGITAALHGNELNGIPVIHQLIPKLKLNTLNGAVVAVIVANVPSLLREQRDFPDGTDLNHIMPGKATGNQSQQYAFSLVDRITGKFDYLVDLHTASEGRINSLYVRADMSEEVTAQMAYLMKPQLIVHNPPSDYTLRGTVAEENRPAITVEIRDPQKFQRDSIRRSLSGIRRVLNHVGIVRSKNIKPQPEKPIMCRSSYWIYTDCGGLLTVLPDVTDFVAKGETIARQIDVFGDLVKEYVAPESGYIIGKSTNPVSQTGSRIVHLGVPMSSDDLTKVARISDGVVKP